MKLYHMMTEMEQISQVFFFILYISDFGGDHKNISTIFNNFN